MADASTVKYFVKSLSEEEMFRRTDAMKYSGERERLVSMSSKEGEEEEVMKDLPFL